MAPSDPSRPSLPRRLTQLLRNRSLRAANRALHLVEVTSNSGGPRPLPQRPIFIVGAPRSGSTLFYQVLTDRYDVGYIANAHCRWYGAPSLVERLRRPLRGRGGSDFSSDYGATTHAWEPSECGEFWYRFFPRHPHHVPLAATTPTRRRRLRAAIRALAVAFDRPLVIKNLYCTLRLEPIAAALPEALFIDIRRDLVDNAQSLLQGRARIAGGYDAWWSAEPPDIDALRALPPHEQVIEQVRSIGREIDRARSTIGDDRFHQLNYEQLCDDPAGSLEAVEQFLLGHGVTLATRADTPQPFECRATVSIDPDLYEHLRSYASSVHG